MTTQPKTPEQLQAENDLLRSELAEAQETLDAIRRGHTDAILVEGPEEPKVYMLTGADEPYRIMVEEMQDGAVTLREDGLVTYCNQQMVRMLRASHEDLLGKHIQPFLAPASLRLFEALLREGSNDGSRGEVALIAADGTEVPALLALRVLTRDIPRLISLVVSDLTEQKRHRKMAASEAFSSAILDQAADAVVVCDPDGRIIRANQAAHRLCGINPLLQAFPTAFPLSRPSQPGPGDPAAGESGESFPLFPLASVACSLRGAEAALPSADGGRRDLLLNAGPLVDGNGVPSGCIITMTDITERKQAEAALAQAKAAAEQANEAKGRFLANMSHELRTPMNAILGMIDVTLAKTADPTVRDCLQTAKGSADLLLTLLNDLLDSAKIESGKLELESTAFSLRKMLDHLTDVLALRASEKGLSFVCRVSGGTPDAVLGDRTRLQQIVLNLAGNAIKFTERGDVEITLRVNEEEAAETHPSSLVCLEFVVRDTGIGIPRSALERLFQPFGQADASMSRRFGGTGLGLSISKSLVELMGGRIWAESEPGQGSTFHFTVHLPLAKELPADSQPPAAIPAAARRQLQVLLAEDNPANQKLATYILRERGHIVEIAEDGHEALRMTRQNHYDAILMDVQMPGMDGLEAAAAIRKRDAGGRRVPIIAMTAHARNEDRERCLAAGMDGYLSKPVSAHEMIGLVENLAYGECD